MCKGYIKIPRKVFSSDIWNEKRVFSRYEALTDLYQSADFNSRSLTVSFRTLADRWRWSVWKVQCFIKGLIDDGYIMSQQASGSTTITIADFCESTQESTLKSTQKSTPKPLCIEGFQEIESTPKSTVKSTPKSTLSRAYKNDNINIMSIEELNNNIPPLSPQGGTVRKKTRSVFVKPTVEEIQAYIDDKGYKLDARQIFDHYEMVGWVYGKGHNPIKDWKAAVRTWNSYQLQQNGYGKKVILPQNNLDNSQEKYEGGFKW